MQDFLSIESMCRVYCGCGVNLRYSFPDGTTRFSIWGKSLRASSLEREGTTIHLSPDVQSTGVATFLVAVSWRESITRRISLKFLPVVAG